MYLTFNLTNARDCSLIAQVVCQTSLRMLLFVHSLVFFFLVPSFNHFLFSFIPFFHWFIFSLIISFFHSFLLLFHSFF